MNEEMLKKYEELVVRHEIAAQRINQDFGKIQKVYDQIKDLTAEAVSLVDQARNATRQAQAAASNAEDDFGCIKLKAEEIATLVRQVRSAESNAEDNFLHTKRKADEAAASAEQAKLAANKAENSAAEARRYSNR